MRPVLCALAVRGLLGVAAAQGPVVFTPVAAGLSAAVDLQAVPGDPTRFYAVEQGGRIRVIEGGVVRPAPLLDIAGRVTTVGELGLLGLALDPGWPERPYLYVHYARVHPTPPGPTPYETVIARFTADPATHLADPAGEEVLLVSPQAGPYHDAGALAFGPDGHLYVGLGDGTVSGNGQDPGTLPGSILRLDTHGSGLPLDCGTGTATVPASNPLADGPGGACDEVFAYGFRNPWRLSFDAGSGRLWAGDVGHAAWEEVDTVAAGGNYGWPRLEGTHCYKPPSGCGPEDTVLPVWEYGHAEGIGVTGGYVYRGAALPDLVGAYVYADLGAGSVWALRLAAGGPPSNALIGTLAGSIITSFGVDTAGELYVVTYEGTIYRLDPTTVGEGGGDRADPLLALAGPNPTDGPTALRLRAAAGGPARLVLLDVLGREAALLFDGTLGAGVPLDVDVDASALAPGLYVARLTTAAGARSLRLVVAR